MGADDAVIQLVTRCSSAEEFIERFARFTTETDFVVPALPHVSVGTEGPFVICLKDRSVVMKGRCEVTEIRPLAPAPGDAPTASRPPLMRLRLREMDAHSAGIHLRLMERHASSPAPPAMTAPESATSSSPASTADAMAAATPPPMLSVADAVPADMPVPEVSAVTTVGDGRSGDTETTAISPAPRTETRVPGAAFTLPANPFGDLDAADLASFVEAHLAPAARAETRLHLAGRIGRRVVPYAGCVLAGMLLGMALRPGPKAAPVVVSAPNPVPPPEAAPPSTASAAAGATRSPAPRDCVARVTTKPAGAAVLWGDIALGSSPLEHAAIPCGIATLTLRRDHYADATRTITTERGRSAVVAERLQRPPAKLVVTSSPPRAIIKLNKRRIGATPSTIDTLRFESVRIEASLPGYQPWKKTLYLKQAESQVDVRLVRIAEPTAQRATPASAQPTRATPLAARSAGPVAAR